MSSGEGELQDFLTALASFPSGARLPKAFPADFIDLEWPGRMSVTGMGTRESFSFCPLTRSQHPLHQCPWLPVLYHSPFQCSQSLPAHMAFPAPCPYQLCARGLPTWPRQADNC